MNTTLILIPVAGLGLAATLVLGARPGDPCKQQCTGVASGAVKAAPASEPTSVAQRSLVRFLGDGQAVATPLAPVTVTTEPVAQGACSAPAAAGACQATQASVATTLTPATVSTTVQAGYGTTAVGGVSQARAVEPAEMAAAAAAEREAYAAQEMAVTQEFQAKRYADVALTEKHSAKVYAQQAAEQAIYAQDAKLRAKEAELAAAQYAKVAPRPYATQERSAPDDYTRSLERRIEALERRLLEREHVTTAPPGVYYSTPGGGGNRIARTPRPGRESVTVIGEDGKPLPYEVMELEDVPGVMVVPPDAPHAKSPAVVAVPRAPRAVATPVPPMTAPAPDPMPEVRAYSLRSGGRGGSLPPGSDLSELTQLIEEMRAQVADLQRDLEVLRDDLHNVRVNRSLGVR